MTHVDFAKIQSVHLIGIGGIGVSALARYFRALGKEVSGSDMQESELTQELEAEGIPVFIGHNTKHISDTTDLVIFSKSIGKGNPEKKEAVRRNISMLSYPQALGSISKDKFTIAVAGTHGKSTITAMIALVLEKGGLDPTVVVGTKVKELENSNFRFGQSQFFLLEACEYKRSFLEYYPTLEVIPNVDLDHLDYFKDEEDYVDAFRAFIKQIPHTGYLIGNAEDQNIQKASKSLKGSALSLHFDDDTFTLNGDVYDYPVIQSPGKHNRMNAAFAFAVGKVLDIPEERILEALSSFSGTWRRMEKKGKSETGALFFDDYAHHPVEIQATLNALRESYPDKRLVAVFQPHQYSRTYHFLDDFARSFTQADEVIIPNIYRVREREEDDQVTTDDLVQAIQGQGKQSLNGGGLEKTAKYLSENTSEDDVVVTMGAGDIGEMYFDMNVQ